MRHHQREKTHHWPLFENMPEHSDEAVWDLLEMLHGLIDAYEDHYAEVLQRLRLERYRELHEPCNDEHQLSLPIQDTTSDPF
jgi:hypothetical protein